MFKPKYKFTYDEIRIIVMALVELKNQLISEGRYTDAVDDLLIRFVDWSTLLLTLLHTLLNTGQGLIQGLTDNKETFKFKDEEIIINEGFKIIGTMNLFVNGNPYPLTPQLCDRCEDIIEFKLTNKKLVKLAFGA